MRLPKQGGTVFSKTLVSFYPPFGVMKVYEGFFMSIPKIQLAQKPHYLPFGIVTDFYALFELLEKEHDVCFLLESLSDDESLSRYSILGFAPKTVVHAKKNTFSINGASYTVENPYETLQSITPQNSLSRNYAGGLVGYLSYDAISYVEKTLQLQQDDAFGQFMFGVYTDGLIYDKMTNETHYFYYDENRIDVIKSLLGKKKPKTTIQVTSRGDSMTKKEHGKIVKKVKEEIIAGNTFQSQIGFRSNYTIHGDPLLLYKRLRKVNPSPYMFYVKFKEKKIIGSSPELLFQLRDHEMETYPLAGTIKRGKTAAEDKALARMLLNDPKERAEHNMLVDLHRNDIGKVAKFGTVKVRRLMEIKKFSHVQHISSEIAGIISDKEDMFSALMSNFPAGTLTGAPKIESMKIIDRLEETPRGPYGGALGHFGFNGNCTFAIPIRTIFINGSDAFIQAASGIVYDSEPEKEYDEIQRKLEALRKVLV